MAIYVGGPCDGRTAPSSGIYARISCGGADYTLHEDGNYYSAAASGGALGAAALGVHAPRGWADLQRATNVSLPTGLSRAKQLRRAAHRKLMQRRRLR